MKKIIQSVSIAGMVLMMPLSACAPSKTDPYSLSQGSSRVREFRYTEASGWAYSYSFDVIRDEDRITLTIEGMDELHLLTQEDSIRIETEITEEQFDGLVSILNEYEIGKWNGFDQSDDNVLDGHGFNLLIALDNGKTIEAHGYMIYPENYDEARNAICRYLLETAGIQPEI